MTRKNGRNTDGTFAAGNSGKPQGSRHRSTCAVLDLLDGEAQSLTRKAVEQALGGDTTALRLCLERIAPPRKDIPVNIDLPSVRSAADAAIAAGAVVDAVAAGELTPTEGKHVMSLIEFYRRILETGELEGRIEAIEDRK